MVVAVLLQLCRTVRASPFRVCAALIVFFVQAALLEARLIQTYNTTQVTLLANGVAVNETHWASYVDGVCESGTRSFVSNYDDAPVFQQIDLTTPFFSADDVPWFVSSNGFLFITRYPMCAYFCSTIGGSAALGDYAFTSPAGAGADWPGLLLYPADLVPSGNANGGICFSAVSEVAGSVDPRTGKSVRTQTVEFDNVPVLDSMNNIVWGTFFKGQVSLYSNGTIIFRYLSAPNPNFQASGSYTPPQYVGLALSASERLVYPTSTLGQIPVALRFEPVFDPCDLGEMSQEQCESTSPLCGMCTTLSTCMIQSTAGSWCPSRQFDSPSEASGDIILLGIDSDSTDYGYANLSNQKFYSVVATTAASMVSEVPSTTLVIDSLSRVDYISFKLKFAFPFFTKRSSTGNVSAGEDDPQRLFQTIYLYDPGRLSVVSPNGDCPDSSEACPSSDYYFSLLPFQTSATWKGKSSSIVAFELASRNRGDTLCNRTSCGAGLVIQVRGVTAIDTSAGGPSAYLRQRFAFQLYIDADGQIDLTYDSLTPRAGDPAGTADNGTYYVSYPEAIVGVTRYGEKDVASIIVPSGYIRQGLNLRFSLASSCADCGAHGRCNESSGLCVCQTGFSVADNCRSCEENYYSAECLPCPACGNGGWCDSGVNGTGMCQCQAGFWGDDCTSLCNSSSAASDTGESATCPDTLRCNTARGTCMCGKCHCYAGWEGPTCDTQSVDMCLGLSLNGCAVCLSSPECAFCLYGQLCYTPGWDRFDAGYKCVSTTLTSADIKQCPSAPVALDYGTADNIGSIAAIIVVVIVVILLLSVVAALCFIAAPPFNLLRTTAARGIPFYKAPRPVRQIVPGALIRGDVVNRQDAVLGIPLRQTSLQRIYSRQRDEPEVRQRPRR